MLARKARQSECKDHQRRWGDFCVDRNLEDSWLVRLNALECFSLMGICEGHADRSRGSLGRYSHLNLRLKERLLPGLAQNWEELRVAVLNEVNKLFGAGDTYINLELRFRLRAGMAKLVYQEELTVRMRGSRGRTAVEMDEATQQWFEDSVGRIEKLDGVVGTWYREHQAD
jgi:hypothetical protein